MPGEFQFFELRGKTEFWGCYTKTISKIWARLNTSEHSLHVETRSMSWLEYGVSLLGLTDRQGNGDVHSDWKSKVEGEGLVTKIRNSVLDSLS